MTLRRNLDAFRGGAAAVDAERIKANLGRVDARIAAACERVGRERNSVTLVAVTKSVDLDEVRTLHHLGIRDFGENRVVELVRKAADLTDLTLTFHMIGHLQRNKVKDLLPHSQIVHSLESEKLARVLSRRAESVDLSVDVLIEVNVAGEEQKYGVSAPSAAALAEKVVALPRLQLRGLMTMCPIVRHPEHARPYFVKLRELADDLSANLPIGSMTDLSMGMTQDYEIAVEEGATMLRIGSALFASS